MNKFYLRLFTFAAVAGTSAMFAGCSDKDDNDNNEPKAPATSSATYVKFQPTLTNFSRATETRFEAGDGISVWAMESPDYYIRELKPSQSYANNHKYTYSNGKFEGSIQKEESLLLNYYAAYPYSANYSDHFNFSIKADQRSIENYKASDLCVARTDVMSSHIVDLDFYHALCQLVINIDSSLGTVTSIDLPNVKPSVTMDMNDFMVASYGSAITVKMYKVGSNSFKAIIPVQIVYSGALMAQVYTSKGDFYWEMSNTTEFQSGNMYVYDLGTDSSGNSSTSSAVTLNAVIMPWDEI